MNILFFHKKIHPFKGGIGRVTCTLADFFQKKGHEVFYFLSEDSGFPLKNAYIIKSGNFLFNDSNKKEFFDFLEKNHIDVVINQTIDSKSYELVLSCRSLGIGIVTVCHTSPLTSVKHFHIAMKERFSSKGIEWILPFFSLKVVNSFLKWIYKRKYHQVYKFLYHGSNYFVLLSEKFLGELSYILGEDCDSRVLAIPNPIPENAFIYGAIEKEKNLLYVGSVNFAAKQTNLLLDIWGKLFREFPDWKLFIVGGGKGLRQAQALSKKKTLERVFFEGYQDPSEYYRTSAIFCLTSSHEGFSMVVVEASASQCVPFAFASYEAVEDVISPHGGEIIPAFDCDEYAKRLRNYMQNAELRELAGKVAQSHVERFLARKVVKYWEEILFSCLEENLKEGGNV